MSFSKHSLVNAIFDAFATARIEEFIAEHRAARSGGFWSTEERIIFTLVFGPDVELLADAPPAVNNELVEANDTCYIGMGVVHWKLLVKNYTFWLLGMKRILLDHCQKRLGEFGFEVFANAKENKNPPCLEIVLFTPQ